MFSNKIISFVALTLIPIVTNAQTRSTTVIDISCNPECNEAVSMIISMVFPDGLVRDANVKIKGSNNAGVMIFEDTVDVHPGGFGVFDFSLTNAGDGTAKIYRSNELLGEVQLTEGLKAIFKIEFQSDTDVNTTPLPYTDVNITYYDPISNNVTSRVKAGLRGYDLGPPFPP